jgi:hypothetical protein
VDLEDLTPYVMSILGPPEVDAARIPTSVPSGSWTMVPEYEFVTGDPPCASWQ